jgi:hypothetical protein
MRRLNRVLLVVAAMTPPCMLAAGATRSATLPFTWREDFQGAWLGQFASYPPAQDAGYDPGLSPTSDYGAPGGRALMRVLKPVRPGPVRFGFLRRLDLVSANHATLAFSYRFEGAASGDQLEIGIAGANGRRYRTVIPLDGGGAWHRVQLALRELHDESHLAPPAGTGIQGLYLVASLPSANPDITYRFLIDDVVLQAERTARFQLVRPRATPLEPRADLFTAATVEPGSRLNIQAVAPVPVSKAECILKDQDGRTASNSPLHEDGARGVWANSNTLRLPERSGVYKLLLNGVTAGGMSVETTVRIIGLLPVSHKHPRLYFGAEDCAKFAARARNPKYVAAWQEIVNEAKLSRSTGDLTRGADIFPMLDRVYLLPTLPGYFDLITKAGQRIQYNALVASITGDAEARDVAKRALLDILPWKSWAPPWFPAHGQPTYYPAGQFTAQIAFAYDTLYNQLSPNERQLVRKALVEKGILPAYREYVVDDRVIANTSNWIEHSVAGALIAAAAIKGDGPDPDLDLYINGLLDKLEKHLAASYLPDGSYGEGISYQEFDMETLGPALIALKRVFGLDYWNRSYVKDSLWYPLSTLADPVSGCLDMGDTHCPAGYSLAPVVTASRNPVFRWYEDRVHRSSWEDFLFADDTLKPQPPAAPGSRYFPTKGAVVFRTGWRPDASILLFRAGPNFNHNHADQGSFLLRALGENLVTEAGYSDYYKDPYYASYFKQAAGHNTVLVDGDPASQEVADTLLLLALHEYPRIDNVLLSAHFDALDSELQQVYRGRLKQFTRRIVFLKPDYILVYDELVPEREAAFDWLLHLPDVSRVTTEARDAIYSGKTASLAVRFLSPSALNPRISDGHLPYTTFNPVAPAVVPAQPAVLNATTTTSSEPVRFLAVLAPAKSSDTARERVRNFRRIDTQDWMGVERTGEVDDRLLFREGPPGQGAFDSWITNAAAWYLRGQPDKPQMVAALGVTDLKRGTEIWFRSKYPASFCATYQNGQIVLDVYSASAQTIQLREPDGRIAELSVEPGSHEFQLAGEANQ